MAGRTPIETSVLSRHGKHDGRTDRDPTSPRPSRTGSVEALVRRSRHRGGAPRPLRLIGVLRQKRLRQRRRCVPSRRTEFHRRRRLVGPGDGTWRSGGSTHQPAAVDLDSGRPYLSSLTPLSWPTSSVRWPICRRGPSWPASSLAPGRPGSWPRWDGNTNHRLAGPADEMAQTADPSPIWPPTDAGRPDPGQRGRHRPTPGGGAGRGCGPLDHCCAELGPGCLELATAHSGPVRSADDAALAKVYTKAFFDRRGRTATFMAQVAEDLPGSAATPASRSARSTTITPGAGADGGLTPRSDRRCRRGRTASRTVAMVATNPNSSGDSLPGIGRRPAPRGVGNTVARSGSFPGHRARPPGAPCPRRRCKSPPVLGHVPRCRRLGHEQGLEPPRRSTLPATVGGDGPVRFPRTVAEAVDSVLDSSAAVDLFGPSFVSHHSGACLAEDEACRRLVPAGERRRYLLEA